jgi:hypothetical protein
MEFIVLDVARGDLCPETAAALAAEGYVAVAAAGGLLVYRKPMRLSAQPPGTPGDSPPAPAKE